MDEFAWNFDINHREDMIQNNKWGSNMYISRRVTCATADLVQKLQSYVCTCWPRAKTSIFTLVRTVDLITFFRKWKKERGFAPAFVNYKKGALDPQPQVVFSVIDVKISGKFTNVIKREIITIAQMISVETLTWFTGASIMSGI
jgi:hypothetical protein